MFLCRRIDDNRRSVQASLFQETMHVPITAMGFLWWGCGQAGWPSCLAPLMLIVQQANLRWDLDSWGFLSDLGGMEDGL